MTLEEVIGEIIRLQTYKLFENDSDEDKLVNRHEVIEILKKLEPKQGETLNCEDAECPMNVKGECTGDEDFCSYEPCMDEWSISDVKKVLEKHGLIKEQEPCDYCISRQAVMRVMERRAESAKSNTAMRELQLAQKEIFDLPSVQPKIEPCDDCISRKDLLSAFPYDDEPTVTKSCLRMTINYMPSVQPKRKTGQWIHDYNNLYGCSLCGQRETMTKKKLKNYCPNCGSYNGGDNNE